MNLFDDYSQSHSAQGSHLIGKHNSDDQVIVFLQVLPLDSFKASCSQDYGLHSGIMQMCLLRIFYGPWVRACRVSSGWAYSRMLCVVYGFCENVIFASDEIWLDGAPYMHMNSSLVLVNAKFASMGVPAMLQCSMVICLPSLLHASTGKAHRDGLTKLDVRSL